MTQQQWPTPPSHQPPAPGQPPAPSAQWRPGPAAFPAASQHGGFHPGAQAAWPQAQWGQPRQVPQGQFAQGQFAQGQFAQGQFPQGQFPQGQFPQGQFPQGQWPAGQQQAYPGGPQWAPAPAKPRSTARKALLIGVMAAVVVVVGFVVIGQLTNKGTDGAYQNEKYQVPPVDENPPPLPVPSSPEEAESWTKDNKLYQQPVARPIQCTSNVLDLTTASESEIQQHFNQLTECLMRQWGPSLEAAGFTPVRPKSVVYSSPITTPCGKVDTHNAFYCSVDQGMYYATDLPEVLGPLASKPWVAEVVWAHEFGHNVQGRMGIFKAKQTLGSTASRSERMELTRRSEGQADCFAGAFMSSVAQSLQFTPGDVENMTAVMRAIGDDTLSGKPEAVGDHGLAATRIAWFTTGYETESIGSCNSWSAPPEKVR